ncbi:MAG: streptogrisin [Micromonosporaceae bacterium]
MRAWVRLGLASAIAVLVVAATGTPAHAAVRYFFRPGHPVFFGTPGNPDDNCTGGYAIRGSDGLFFLTSGFCGFGEVGATVYGTGEHYGTLAFNKYPMPDTALIKPDADVDAYQMVVDPVTGASPGRVVGLFSENNLIGAPVGKMGRGTGWTEGTVYLSGTYGGMAAYCSTATTGSGDLGGPVWQSDGAGHVWAVGITIGVLDGTTNGCFYPIQRLLDAWGAWMPVFAFAGSPPAAHRGQAPPAAGGSQRELDIQH